MIIRFGTIKKNKKRIGLILGMILLVLVVSSVVSPKSIVEFVQKVGSQIGNLVSGSSGGWHRDALDGKREDLATTPTREQEAAEAGNLVVHFLDVGQGNAILIASEDEYMLIDGGNKGHESFVVSYLQNQNIYKLQYLLASHYDADHISGGIAALQMFAVGTVLDAGYVWDTGTYETFRSAVAQSGCEEIHPKPGESYRIGNASFSIVTPQSYDHEDHNDNSIGVRLCYGDTSFLICGDAGSQMEEEMIACGVEIDSDVLVCSHHGSTYSTSEEFLEAVSPQVVVLSCGYDNDFGHPSERVMRLLQEGDYELYRTDVQSTVIATSDGKKITWNKPPTDDYSYRIPE